MNNSSGGASVIVLSSGPLMEIINIQSLKGVQPSDLQHVAQRAAGYIDAAGLGS